MADAALQAVAQVTAAARVRYATEDGAEPITLEAGTAAIFPIGWQGTWEIQERIRKFFVIFAA